jgi:hypothetical protein
MASFSFGDVGRALDARSATGAAPPKAFLPSDAKNRFYDGSDQLRGHVPGHASLIEILASRWFYVLNCCDYQSESVITMVLRPLGWGSRLAFYAFSAVFMLMSMNHESNPLLQYTFSRERDGEGTLRNDDSDIFEPFVYAIFAIWVFSIATEMLSYLVGRGAGRPHAKQCSAFPIVLFNRVAIPAESSRCCFYVLLALWYVGATLFATAMLHTIISHLFVTRNFYFAVLFAVLTAFQLLAALADAVSIGGIDGLAVSNRPGSWLASMRVVVLLPIQVIGSVAFIILCFPSYA